MADEDIPHPTQALIAGHFELREELGRGASGTVYRARLLRPTADLPPGAEVAVKFLRHDARSDPEAESRLQAEGRIGMLIRSEQVVRIYAVETFEVLGVSATYLVMELIRGRSLRQVLRDSGSVVEELARRIGLDAARGLLAVHGQGLVHRDVKPENLALTDSGAVKLMDLGLVRRIQRGDAATAGFYGSLSYAAPELLRGGPAQPASDLYALGVVLYEMVTGVHPFAGEGAEPDLDAMIDAHLRRTPPRPSHKRPRISAFLEQLILDLLAKDPSDRPGSTAELVTTLSLGESSRYWIRSERRAPQLAGQRRLRRMRRVADTPFVGRRAERRVLDGHLRQAMEGRGRVVFLTGPGGSGRRRLLDEWLDEWLTRRDDIAFLGGEARGGAGLRRAAPFAEMLLDWFLRGDRADSPNVKSRLSTRLTAEAGLDPAGAANLAGIIGDAELTSTPEERADLIAQALLALRPKDHTLVLRVDKAEELSTTANLVVARLLDEVRRHRVLIVLVSLEGRLPAPGMHHLPLAGLSEAEFLSLAEHLFAPDAVPRDLIRQAHRTLSGNPGHLLDALAALHGEGRLLGSPGKLRLVAEVTDLRPARSLLDRVGQQVALLDSQQRFVHLAAAVLGQSFPIADLAALVGQTELAVLETLSVLQGRVIITSRGHGQFRHRDFRKELLKIAPPDTRRRLHRMAAWMLEDRGARPVEIGLQLSRAGEHAAAIPHLLAGLQELVASGSRQVSLRVRNRLRIHFDQLPELARSPSRLRFLLLAGRTDAIHEKLDRARTCFHAAVQLAEDLADGAGAARARIQLAELDLTRGRLHDSLEAIAAAERTLPEDDRHLRARALSLRARAMGYLGRSGPGLEAVRGALELLADVVTDDPAGGRSTGELVAHLHVDLARLQALRHDFAAALLSLGEAELRFAATGSRLGALRVLLHHGRVLAILGSRRQAEPKLRQAAELARQLANSRAGARARLFLGELAVWHRQTELAIHHLAAAIDLATTPGDQLTRLFAAVHLAGLGREPAELEARILELEVPALRIAWLLHVHERSGEDRVLAEAVALAADVTVPLPLHLRLLRATGRGEQLRECVRGIADQLTGGMRRRFLASVGRS